MLSPTKSPSLRHFKKLGWLERQQQDDNSVLIHPNARRQRRILFSLLELELHNFVDVEVLDIDMFGYPKSHQITQDAGLGKLAMSVVNNSELISHRQLRLAPHPSGTHGNQMQEEVQ